MCYEETVTGDRICLFRRVVIPLKNVLRRKKNYAINFRPFAALLEFFITIYAGRLGNVCRRDLVVMSR